jgi:hypothetical protein
MEYLMAASVGIQLVSSIFGHKSQSKQNKIAAQAAKLQAEEVARQRKLEEERQRRENEELMNSVSNLTNVAWSGASAPTMAFDKYGDLG